MNNHEEVVPRALVAKEFNVSARTVRRWEESRLPGFDTPVEINKRVHYPRSCLKAAKTSFKRAAG